MGWKGNDGTYTIERYMAVMACFDKGHVNAKSVLMT